MPCIHVSDGIAEVPGTTFLKEDVRLQIMLLLQKKKKTKQKQNKNTRVKNTTSQISQKMPVWPELKIRGVHNR